MQSFVDEATVEVVSGDGGQGTVHFRREKYVPKGGPDGGDGGRGGDVVFLVKDNLKTLFHLKTKHVFKAKNGAPGGGKRKHGRDGEDVEIPVPPGTIIKDGETGEILRDLNGTEERWVFLEGGKGGLGNYHFRTSKNQTPRYAQPGIPGKRAAITVELRIIADIGSSASRMQGNRLFSKPSQMQVRKSEAILLRQRSQPRGFTASLRENRACGHSGAH